MEFSDDKQYVCHLCEARFSAKVHLRRHSLVHSQERPFACTQCPNTFKTKQHLKVHSVVHTGERPFKCPFCEETFKYQSHMGLHRRLHTGIKELQCPECRRGFISNQMLEAHMATHSDERFIVRMQGLPKALQIPMRPLLPPSDSPGQRLPLHLQVVQVLDAAEEPARCPLEDAHGERSHKCDLCDKAFIERTALLKHIRAIHENLKPFKCEKCDYSAATTASLTLHVRTVHDEVRRFGCHKWDFRTNQAVRLKKHVLKEHGNRAANTDASKKTARTASKGSLKEPELDAPSTTPVSKSGRAQRSTRKSAIQSVGEGPSVSGTAGTGFEFHGTLSASAVKEECVDLVDAILNACKVEPKDEFD